MREHYYYYFTLSNFKLNDHITQCSSFFHSYTVPKKEATEFTKDLVNKVENSSLKVAVEKAMLFLEKNELPPHWDKDSLFGNAMSSGNSDTDNELDSDVSTYLSST